MNHEAPNLFPEVISDNQLLDAIPLGVDVVEKDLNIIYMNKAMRNLVGEGMVGKKCYMVYRDEHNRT